MEEWCPQLSPDSAWLRSKRWKLGLSSSSAALEPWSPLSCRVSFFLQKVQQSRAIAYKVVAQGPSELLTLCVAGAVITAVMRATTHALCAWVGVLGGASAMLT